MEPMGWSGWGWAVGADMARAKETMGRWFMGRLADGDVALGEVRQQSTVSAVTSSVTLRMEPAIIGMADLRPARRRA
jgi:hypothetical protein